MGFTCQYPIDFRVKVLSEYKQGKVGYKTLANKYGLKRDTVRYWVLQEKSDSFMLMDTKNKETVDETQKDIEYYKTEAEYWKTYAKKLEAIRFPDNKKKTAIEAIKELYKRGHSIKLLCKIAGISRATYYYQKDNTRKDDKDLETLEMIKKLPEKQLRYAGAKAKAHYLKLLFGVKMNHKRILRVSNIYGIHVENRVKRFPNGYYQTLKENETNLPKNILNREFTADKPLQKLVTDISYFKIKNGWLYLSAVMDLFNNEILSFRMSRHADSNLAVETINSLCDKYNVSNALIHSDQGSTYKASEYRRLLKEKGFIQSMSRVGNCWDNACMEHFFGTLKAESGYYDVNKHGLLSYQMMEELITDFIQFYNKDRIQKKLGWKSPMTFSLKCA